MMVLWFVVGVVAGACLGLVFFGGLWWTTQRLFSARQPGLLLAGSLLARLVILGLSLVVLAQVDPAALIGAMFGLIGVRIAMVRAASSGRLGSLTDGVQTNSVPSSIERT